MIDDTKAQAVRRLGEGVRERTGIKLLPQTEDKLLRIFGTMPTSLLLAWVGMLEQLPHDHPEWQAVIENLTVHESFFFRDRQQLEALQSVLPGLIEQAAENGRRIKVWSAGCAAGEEAYTLAILILQCLRDMGLASGTPEDGFRPLPGWSVSVLGTDISRPVLNLARQGVYLSGEMSPLRSLPPGMDAWFEPGGVEGNSDIRRIREHLKQFVSFQPYNLMEPLPPGRDFTLVLCRNVFIYFTPEAQARAQATFATSISPNGILMLGPTDQIEVPELFTIHWQGEAVFYRPRQS